MVNFHIHTRCSDGVLSPEELVKCIKKIGIEYFSITDHDTIDAYKKIKYNKLITGVELSSKYNLVTCHILGYDIDLETIDEFCKKLRRKRYEKGLKMLDVLKKLGYDINLDTENEIIGRRQLANQLVDKGYYNTVDEALDSLFIKGKPCYIELNYPTVSECIDIIHKANGIAILAHPWTIDLDINQLESFIKEYNFDGIEVYNHKIDKTLYQELNDLSDKLNIYKTCGTDYHGYGIYNDLLINEEIECSKFLNKVKRGK